MAFVVDVSADLYGVKDNRTIEFETRPYLGELKAKIESVFQVEATRQCPAGETPTLVRVRAMSIYDDNRGQWEDLLSCDQLFSACQLYAFQHGSEDRQAEIPASSPPRVRKGPGGLTEGAAVGAAPLRGASPHSSVGAVGAPPGHPSHIGGPSPERQRALSDYDQARRKADQARMDKELAEQQERHAWDRLAVSPH
eukprot:TRINITY_DN12607_c0_g1_i2.p1 TRINITY_DN12607_c0_g1~~TRINITY_DN12607_c0_g1_i2.p1  ORF type:complete len:217 (+),score=76.43 TRINITY_DN12607_c0_g1_i2:64-651(+)